jgi:hypothetical protein
MRRPRLPFDVLAVVAALVPPGFEAQELSVPNRRDSVKFAAIGDNGTGEQPEYDVANQMALWHRRFPFDMVIMLGDNMYGSQREADFTQKFERPYRPLLLGRRASGARAPANRPVLSSHGARSERCRSRPPDRPPDRQAL